MKAINIRGFDKWGCGEFKSKRGGRLHKGVDFIVLPKEPVVSFKQGRVTKIGFPYPPDDKVRGKYRYVEVSIKKYYLRYFYVDPGVAVGDNLVEGQILGYSQDITLAYPGMTHHFHFEVKDRFGIFYNPILFLQGRLEVF